MSPHAFSNSEIQNYFQNEPKVNAVYSRNNLPKSNDWAYVINLDEYKSTRTHWIALYVNNNLTYFVNFGVEHIPKEIKKFIGNKTITTNIYKMEEYDSIMCGYFCIGFIKFMLKDKSLLDDKNLFSHNEFENK